MPPRKEKGKPVSGEGAGKEENPLSVCGLNLTCDDLLVILENYPEYMYVSDPETYEVLFVNRRLRDLLNVSTEGKRCHKLFHGLDAPCEFCTNDIIMKTGLPHVWDNYSEHLKRHFLNNDRMITWHDGRKVRFETAIDITDQKKVEALLQATETKYRNFIDRANHGIFIMNTEYQVTYLNRNAEEIYGRKMKPGEKLNISDLVKGGDYDNAISRLNEMKSGKDVSLPGEYIITDSKGRMRYLEVQTFPIWRDGRIAEYHGIISDITERRNSENIIREQTDLFNAVIENTSEGIFVVNEDVRYVLINPACGRMLMHDPKDWIGKKAGGFKHPEDSLKSAEAFMKAMGGEPSSCEVRVMASDGQYRLLDIKFNRMLLNGEYHVLGVASDITESRKAKIALEKSEEHYRSLFNQAVEGIILMPTESESLIVNDTFAKMHGYDSPEDMAHIRFQDLDTPESAKLAPERLRRLLSGETIVFEAEHYHRDGHVIPLQVSCRVIDIAGTPHYMGFHLDITERKRIEERMRENERRLAELGDNLLDGVIHRIVQNPKGELKMDYVSRGANNVFGIDPETIMNDINSIYSLIHPDDYTKMRANELASLQEKRPFIDESRYILKDGTQKWIQMRAKPHILPDGTTVWDGIALDITRLKEAEIAIAQSEDKYRSLFDNSPEAILILGKDGRIIECNRATAGLMEMKAGDIVGKRFDELGIFDTAKSELFLRIFKEMTEGKEINIGEMELIMNDGRSKWIETFPSIIARAGEFYGIQMIARDITDRKSADTEMRKKLLRYDIEFGNVYLLKEPSAAHSLEAFMELLMIGNEGLLISRKSRKDFLNQIDREFNHVKVSETDKESHVKPDYKSIIQLVSNVPRGHVIHIDCMEYLISRIGPKKTVMLVQYLKDLAMAKGLAVLISVDPNAIPEKELRLIEKESVDLLPPQPLTKLSQKSVDILIYIDDMNRKGKQPSYSDICEYFNISKPTARDRIRLLCKSETVKEIKKGRMKLLEITNKGRNHLVV